LQSPRRADALEALRVARGRGQATTISAPGTADDSYDVPFRFTGTIDKLTFKLPLTVQGASGGLPLREVGNQDFVNIHDNEVRLIMRALEESGGNRTDLGPSQLTADDQKKAAEMLAHAHD
jgi:hypothetical protein